MDQQKSLPFLQTSRDAIREGIMPLQSGVGTHPVEHIQNNWAKDQMKMDQFATTKIFGTHMVARMNMEREILQQFQRLPVLDSSFVGLETLLGTDEDIDFEDYLNDPKTSEKLPGSVHDLMETKLGLQIAYNIYIPNE